MPVTSEMIGSKAMRVAAACFAATALTMSVADFAHADEATKTWSYEGDYIGDVLGVVSGGTDQGVRYLDELEVEFSYDGTAHGLKGITARAGFVYNNRASLTQLSGDLQEVSNIESEAAALRHYEVWIAKTWGEDRAMVKAGFIELVENFATQEASEIFLNSSYETDFTLSQTGGDDASLFSDVGLAIMGEVKLSENARLRLGAFDSYLGSPGDDDVVNLAWRQSDGALLIGEVEFSFDKARIVGGAWGYTNESEPLFLTDPSKRKSGIYALGEYEHSDAVTYFVRAGHAAKDLNLVDNFIAAGALWTGPFAGRKSDQLGLAIAYARFGSDVIDSGLVKSGETNIELTYLAEITDNFSLQGDIQYIANPAGGVFADKAVVVGLRAMFEFGG